MTLANISAAMILAMMLMMTTSHVVASPVSGRARRSDDVDPLEAVVGELSERLSQLTAQLEGQGAEFSAEINALKSAVALLDTPVAFTAVFTTSDLEGLRVGEVLKFDRVLFNAGNGYSPSTGLFTAPSAGTYVFYNRVMRNFVHEELIQTAIYKGNSLLAWADACCHGHDSGTSLVTMHLDQGETVHVQVHSGSQLWGDHTIFTGFKLGPM